MPRKDERTLSQILEDTHAGARQSFHMPGHKGLGSWAHLRGFRIAHDTTELTETDDLHAPKGVLRRLLERTARRFGADESRFLCNGSTSGNLIAIYAALCPGDPVLVDRASHRSVFHALELTGAAAYYPPVQIVDGMAKCLDAESIRQAFVPGTKACILTSPTYDGRIVDGSGIADFLHRNDCLLIVDEAHGAHLDLFPETFAGSFLRRGADLVIQSLHKTLPAPTPSALLHRNGSRVDEARLGHAYDLFESSSPSYLLLEALEGLLDYFESGLAAHEFRTWRSEAVGLTRTRFRHLKLAGTTGRDPAKIFIYTKHGQALYREARAAGFEGEMIHPSGVLFMSGLRQELSALTEFFRSVDDPRFAAGREAAYPLPTATKPRLTLSEARDRATRSLPFRAAVGETAGAALWIYPPGIPLLLPGEAIEADLADALPRLENDFELRCERPRRPGELHVLES